MAKKSPETMSEPSVKPLEHTDPAHPDSPGENLLVGQSVLRFHSTLPNQESYLILKVTPPAPGAIVSLSTDLPDVFQVAVGVDSLTFTPTLTFTPPDQGLYIHLRYLPQWAGSHRGQLTVQSGVTTQTVWLLGRTRGMRGLIRARRQATSRAVSAVLAGIVLLALIGAAYLYRCQLMPSLCEAPAPPAAPTTVIVPPEPAQASVLASIEDPEPTRSKRKQRTANPQAQTVAPPPETSTLPTAASTIPAAAADAAETPEPASAQPTPPEGTSRTERVSNQQ